MSVQGDVGPGGTLSATVIHKDGSTEPAGSKPSGVSVAVGTAILLATGAGLDRAVQALLHH